MLRLGPAGIPLSCKNCDTLKGIEKVAELGLNAMEVEFVRGITLSPEKARKAGEIAEKLNVKLSVHAPYYINLASQEKEKVKASIKRILDSLQRASAMHANVVVVHAGYYGKDKTRAGEMIFQACRKIAREIEKRKWNVFLGLETMGRQSQWGTLEEIISLCMEIPKCVPVVDFAHIYARNGGKIDYKAIFKALKELELSFLHTHFSGIKFKKTLAGGNEQEHLPLKKASGPSFEELAKFLVKSKLARKMEITIISESPLLEKDALLMKEMLEKAGYKF